MALLTVQSYTNDLRIATIVSNLSTSPTSQTALAYLNQIVNLYSRGMDSAAYDVAYRYQSSTSPSANNLRIQTSNYVVDVYGTFSPSGSTATEIYFYNKNTQDLITMKGSISFSGQPFTTEMKQGSTLTTIAAVVNSAFSGYKTVVLTLDGELSLGTHGFTGKVNTYKESLFDYSGNQILIQYNLASSSLEANAHGVPQITDGRLSTVSYQFTGGDGKTTADALLLSDIEYNMSEVGLSNPLATVLKGNDTVILTGPGTMPVRTGSGNDIIQNGPGNTTIDGGDGLDALVQSGARANYTVTKSSSNGGVSYTVSGADGSDTLSNVERIKFSDVNIALDTSGTAGQAYRLYQAAFNRTPDKGGLGYQMNALDSGASLEQVAHNFINSPEFVKTYGNLDDVQFVTQLYQNVLHRAPDSAGLSFHVNNLSHGVSRAQTLVGFSESPENQTALIGVIQNGMEYIAVA
ncbi:DUF4214 domain-containing protein [Noviherbaspirillum sp. ST9]|uniref:DUF4214 domain-containing protein n=1 Tax=Noviherbaspirillum sp. ST9 TaxID=3401606 RepID=UPI003B587C4B